MIEGDEKHLDTGSYHCQQAAEKAIKAWLTAHEVIFTKTHSLETLLRLCLLSAPDLQKYLSHAEELTPFATEFCYPGETFEPSTSEALRGLLLATELTSRIVEKFSEIPDPTSLW